LTDSDYDILHVEHTTVDQENEEYVEEVVAKAASLSTQSTEPPGTKITALKHNPSLEFPTSTIVLSILLIIVIFVAAIIFMRNRSAASRSNQFSYPRISTCELNNISNPIYADTI